MSCAVADCGRAVKCHGLCNRHLLRLRRHGSPTAGARERNSSPPATCSIEGCGAPHEALGFCAKHYKRLRQHGNAAAAVNGQFSEPSAALEARREILNEPCWIWTGGVTKQGYGALRINDETVLAHRFALEQHLGRPIADGMDVHHHCRNRRCVNPAHLEEIGHAEHASLHGFERAS